MNKRLEKNEQGEEKEGGFGQCGQRQWQEQENL